jgi:hypothetical protein
MPPGFPDGIHESVSAAISMRLPQLDSAGVAL